MKQFRIAVIAGDGIGKEVIPIGKHVVDVACEHECEIEWVDLPWSSDFYREHGRMMPEDGLVQLRSFDSIYLGAVGDPPDVPDYITLWGLLLPIRKQFDLHVNVRPVRLMPGIQGPLRNRGPEDIDMLFVRENTEGEYAGAGGRVHQGTEHEVALQTSVFSRFNVERVVRYAFDIAQRRRKHLTSITKSNAMQYGMPFWDDVVNDVAREFPDVEVSHVLVDAAAAAMITKPQTFDVVVGSNLFADILTDLGGALMGSLGLPPSANIAADPTVPSLFEPVHGSAPDIAGQGIANPIGTVWAGAMMLDQLGESDSASRIVQAIEAVCADGSVLTGDLGGSATTVEVGEAIVSALRDQN
ncbi:MAG: tartrate dehydrogenase [Sphaerobacteraceae bacterium]|nr:MAG: tartrate dehydrogenase [Sphaerobacteraceae bacterium]